MGLAGAAALRSSQPAPPFRPSLRLAAEGCFIGFWLTAFAAGLQRLRAFASGLLGFGWFAGACVLGACGRSCLVGLASGVGLWCLGARGSPLVGAVAAPLSPSPSPFSSPPSHSVLSPCERCAPARQPSPQPPSRSVLASFALPQKPS